MPVSLLKNVSDYTEVTADVAFGAARTPDPDHATVVIASITIESTSASEATVEFQIDGAVIAETSVLATSGALTGANDVVQTESVTLLVPEGSSYTVVNSLDPAGTNSIDIVNEATLT